MLLNRAPLYSAVILCLIIVYTLFCIKDKVISIRTELKEVAMQIQREGDMIHLFKAELSYLSSPDRINALSNKYLNLKETKVSQMIIDPLKEKDDKLTIKLSDSKLKISNVKWRYRKGRTKYLTLVSAKAK